MQPAIRVFLFIGSIINVLNPLHVYYFNITLNFISVCDILLIKFCRLFVEFEYLLVLNMLLFNI